MSTSTIEDRAEGMRADGSGAGAALGDGSAAAVALADETGATTAEYAITTLAAYIALGRMYSR